jgi:hypothetical protein
MNGMVGEEKEFLLTVIGANPALRTIVVSLCKLYRYLAKPVVAEDLKAVLHQYIPEMQLH